MKDAIKFSFNIQKSTSNLEYTFTSNLPLLLVETIKVF